MIERSDVDQMAKFMLAVENHNKPSSNVANSVTPSKPVITGDVAEMKAILERFHSATDNVLAEAEFDADLRESLLTEKIDNGARIGGWEIVANKTDKTKMYDVINSTTREKIAADLLLYEAAYGLVQYLNNGGYINSVEMLNLLRAEQAYANAVHDVRLYKHHIKKSPNSSRVSIYEDRYQAASRAAETAKRLVEKLSKRIL